MRSRNLLVLALTGLVAAACARDEADVDDEVVPGTETTPPATPEPAPAGDMLVSTTTFEKTAAAGERAITGTAELRRTGMDANSPFELHVRLTGLTADTDHPWHIHRGTCSDADAPIAIAITDAAGQDGVGDPLKPGADGVAEQTVRIPTERLTQEQLNTESYSVHVHEGAVATPGAGIACANIQRR